MKFLLAPNSFKECADSVRIAQLLKEYLDFYFNRNKGIGNISFLEMPISDGGDGFLNVCKSVFNAEINTLSITNPYNENYFNCEYGISENTAYIETAKVLGLNLIPNEYRHPLYLSSKGLGDLLQKLTERNQYTTNRISKAIIGIGGTGTNDFGIGLCSRLGLKLLDGNNNELVPIPANFIKTEKILREISTPDFDLEIVLDVTNPLLGENGASRVFGPQKGASREEIEILEEGLAHLIQIIQKQDPGFDINDLYGAGGGLAGGLHYFLKADYILAENFIRNEIGINKLNFEADCIITGEGCFDNQSDYNKGAALVINEFIGTGKPIFICAGKVEDNQKFKVSENLFFIELSRYFNSIEDSVKNIRKGIQSACKEIYEICIANHYIS